MNTPDANPADTRVSILGSVEEVHGAGFELGVVSTSWKGGSLTKPVKKEYSQTKVFMFINLLCPLIVVYSGISYPHKFSDTAATKLMHAFAIIETLFETQRCRFCIHAYSFKIFLKSNE